MAPVKSPGAVARSSNRQYVSGPTLRAKPIGLAPQTLNGEPARLIPSPAIDLNRAVASGMAVGSQPGLDLVDAPASDELSPHVVKAL
jgi:hypothetical protein